MPAVVMSPGADLAHSRRQPRLGASERLTLPLFVAAKDEGSIRRIEVKLLIVDDSRIVRESVSHLAHALGYIPVAVSSGPDALKEISEGGVCIVLLDYDLNGMNGTTVAKIAREADPDVRIIGMSALGDVASTAFRDVGVHEMLRKPFGLSDLEKIFRR